MSELLMECVEEELEPWQKQAPDVHLIEDDDDDEPIFVGVLSNNQKEGATYPPPQKSTASKPEIKQIVPKSSVGSSSIMLPLNVTGNAVNTITPNMMTVTPQPVIVNNQGFIVTSPNLTNNRDLIASLGNQYPPGTSFTIVSAGQQQLFQQVTPTAVIPQAAAVHRPQVQQISNNVVTLANVRGPAVYSSQPAPLQLNLPNSQPQQTFALPVQTNNTNKDQNLQAKRILPSRQTDNAAKKLKVDFGAAKSVVPVENGVVKIKCLKCDEQFPTPEALRTHMMSGCANVPSAPVDVGSNKRIMLVSDFYYGRFEGERNRKDNTLRTNSTFKCQSCLKVLKNNIRFMNHMKHHLELEKQNSESWESHTTCQHCYRKYGTPFQLQCHIEAAHSPIESSANCKICELAFESEQVLLEHMKDNHKPGEMPYVCQVCNYRSSFFSDVEAHFRSAHENTKDLLCPFCLKVLKSGHIYMQHYMRHQKKGIYRCGKCRLNFLTLKEKLEHKTFCHKTFRKPKALEGLPPGTKVTIRASLTGKATSLPTSPDRLGQQKLNVNQKTKPPFNISNTKSNVSAEGKTKTTQRKKQNNRTIINNVVLRNYSLQGKRFTCIECNSQVDNFLSHYPMVSSCGACKYKTSCKVAIGNHMIRFHSTITKNRFIKMDGKKHSPALKLTLACLTCDLRVEGSAADVMTRHLTDRPNHTCKVIQEKDKKAQGRVPNTIGQPVKLVYLLSSTTAQKPKETDLKLAEGVSPEGVDPEKTDEAESKAEAEPMLPEGDLEKSATEIIVIEEHVLKSSQPDASSASEEISAPCEESVGNSEILEVEDQQPVPEQETGEQKTGSE